MPPVLGPTSRHQRGAGVPAAFLFRFRATLFHRTEYQGAHLERIRQVQPRALRCMITSLQKPPPSAAGWVPLQEAVESAIPPQQVIETVVVL